MYLYKAIVGKTLNLYFDINFKGFLTKLAVAFTV